MMIVGQDRSYYEGVDVDERALRCEVAVFL